MVEPGNAHRFAVSGPADKAQMRSSQKTASRSEAIEGMCLRDRAHSHDFFG